MFAIVPCDCEETEYLARSYEIPAERINGRRVGPKLMNRSIQCGLAGLFLFAMIHSSSGADFHIDEIRRENGRAEVSFAKEPAFYYILRRGDEPTDIRLVTDLALGSAGPNSLADTNSTNTARFYRVEKVPMT